MKQKGYYPTGEGHRLYYEIHRNPQGIPAIYLHGAQSRDLASLT